MRSEVETKRYWWLAINGASCAASFIDLPSTVKVSPIPEQLLGYHTQDEQLTAQQFLLNAPIDEVTEYMQAMPDRIQRKEVVYIRPENPEEPTHGPTLWVTEPLGDEDDGEIVEGTSRFGVLNELLK